MNHEKFQIIDNEAIDNSIMKRVFLKIYHQQAAILKDSEENIDFIFGKNNIYHQIGIAYLQYEMTIDKEVANAADRLLVDGDVIRLVIRAFAYYFKGARLSTTVGSDIEHNKYVGADSTIIRALTKSYGDLLSHLD